MDGKENKHLEELFEMWNQEHLENIQLKKELSELIEQNVKLKSIAYENSTQTR